MTTSPRRDGGSHAEHAAQVQLCQRVSQNDRVAAESLARTLMPVVRTVARRLTKTPDDAKDACQVALLEILRAAGSYRGDGSLRGWAARVAMRRIARWNARHGTGARPVTAMPPALETAVTLSTVVVDELPRSLGAYLAELSEPQRTALVLRHSMGCTLPEIAEITQSPLPTVKSRIQAALQRVRQAVRRDTRFGGQEAQA